MAHIAGHIDEGVGSCGVLHPAGYEGKGLFFVPPNFEVQEGDEVEFLVLEIPINSEGDTIQIAYDLRVPGRLAFTRAESDERYRTTSEFRRFYRDGRRTLETEEVLRKITQKIRRTPAELSNWRDASHGRPPYLLRRR